MNPAVSQVARRLFSTAAFARTIARGSGRIIMSTYRSRIRASSESGLYSLGSGRSVFAASDHERAWTDSSPRRLVTTSPRTARRSPRSTSDLKSASDGSPRSASDSITWSSVPSPSRSRTKHSLPVLRRNITRPATATVSPVCVSGARSWPS
jgi:hypothetical protein